MELEDVRRISEELGFPCVIPSIKAVKSELKPTDIYAKLREDGPSFLLESAITGEKIARYSFLGNSPEKVLSIKDRVLSINGVKKEEVEKPLDVLRGMLSGYNVYRDKMPRFFGGLLGYFSYDIVRYFEDIGAQTVDDLQQNDAEFMFVKDLIVFDHWREEVLLVSNIL
ncbi:MAG: hypothetical protein V3T58_03590, partial [Candidatus Hydrothermarchaeales archaeon]